MKWEQREAIIPCNSGDTVLSRLAKIRGLNLEQFLVPDAGKQNDPYLLDNIEDAANRIIRAAKTGEKICISADCDSDGIFSTAIMTRYLRQFTDKLYVIYAQRSEGHGIEHQMHKILPDTNLLIILDSSTNSVDACDTITSSGIDIVILDHHGVEVRNPHAIIVNPQNDIYPNKEISGAAVTYKTIQVIDDTLCSGMPEEYLDLVACGMYADMMSALEPENRYLITTGMQNINNEGLKAILYCSKIEVENFTCSTIGYTISPLINGVARMDQIELAIDLLLEDDYVKCVNIVHEMKSVNEKRKQIARKLFDSYSAQVDPNDKVLIAIDENASKGFNGVIANELAQQYQRPALVLRRINGILTGSYRTFGNFKMKSFLNTFPMITYALGHEEAGGVELKEIHLDHFKEFIDKKIKSVVSSKLEYDFDIDAREVTVDFIQDIERFNYLVGKDIPPAKILVKNLFVEERKVMGKNRDTVKIICDGLECIKFKVTPIWAKDVDFLDDLDVIGSLSLNEWVSRKGKVVTNQIIVDDYKKHER